jgi:hypothetical protein
MVSKISLPCSDFISLHTALSPVASPFRPSPIYSDSRLHRGVTALTRRAKLPKLPGGIHQVPRSTGAPILSPQPQQLLQLFFFPALPSFFFCLSSPLTKGQACPSGLFSAGPSVSSRLILGSSLPTSRGALIIYLLPPPLSPEPPPKKSPTTH